MKIRNIINQLAVLLGGLFIAAGCVLPRDTVRVTDAVSGSPIHGAKIIPVYPSLNGPAYLTDRDGVARIEGLGLPRGTAGHSVEVSAPGYDQKAVRMFGNSTNHLEVTLKPTPKP